MQLPADPGAAAGRFPAPDLLQHIRSHAPDRLGLQDLAALAPRSLSFQRRVMFGYSPSCNDELANIGLSERICLDSYLAEVRAGPL